MDDLLDALSGGLKQAEAGGNMPAFTHNDTATPSQ